MLPLYMDPREVFVLKLPLPRETTLPPLRHEQLRSRQKSLGQMQMMTPNLASPPPAFSVRRVCLRDPYGGPDVVIEICIYSFFERSVLFFIFSSPPFLSLFYFFSSLTPVISPFFSFLKESGICGRGRQVEEHSDFVFLNTKFGF
jgi:hypothetical protein